METRKQILPLKTVEEVLGWSPSEPAFSYPGSCSRSQYYLPGQDTDLSWGSLLTAPLSVSRSRVKTVVCHDMMGGYLQDRFLDGGEEDGYHFRHWSNIDIFIYFSHHLLTIPPVGWITAARVHGVQVLGTLITEWDRGQEMLESVLRDDDKMDKFVDVCTRLCLHYGFHGWLLNIENKVEKELVPQLIKFTKNMTMSIKQHLGEDTGVVLWYDSVTVQGELSWQNELNSSNKPFFDVCDGIFLNYTWTCGAKDKDGNVTPDSLTNSVNALGQENDSRRTDILVGVDVFGRGCLGGGGFQCDTALREIRKRNLSVAIFAPGWTFEIPFREREESVDAEVQRQFVARDLTFWGLLQPFLNIHASRFHSTSAEQEPGDCVFSTCFSLGRQPGSFNLTRTQPQPSILRPSNEGENNEASVLGSVISPLTQDYSCFVSDDCSLLLGQSLKINTKQPRVTVPIFITELPIKTRDSLLFVLTVKDNDLNILNTKEASWRKMAFIFQANGTGTDHKTIHKIGLEIENTATIFIGKFEIYRIPEKKE